MRTRYFVDANHDVGYLPQILLLDWRSHDDVRRAVMCAAVGVQTTETAAASSQRSISRALLEFLVAVVPRVGT